MKSEADAKAEIFLISYSPPSGIGFYEYRGTTYRFNILDEDTFTAPTPAHPPFKKFGQTTAGFYFEKMDDLKDFATQMHLREQKELYYISLFTVKLKRSIQKEILQHLNSPEFAPIPLSKAFIDSLNGKIDKNLFQKTWVMVEKCRLENVKECIVKELQPFFSEINEIIK